MTGNIIGEEIEKFVADQVKNRQTISGAGAPNNPLSRSNKVLNFLNNRNSWVKLASGIGISDDAKEKIKNLISSDGYQGSGEADANGNKGFTNSDLDALFGEKLAQNFVLFNTIQSLKEDGTYTTRKGVIDNTAWKSSFDKMYGGMGFKGQGLQPVPGITGVSVECINRGSLKKAVVTLKAFNKFQFGVIELLYLRLGYVMLLEFGWDKYIDSIDTSTTPASINIENVGSTVIENKWFKKGNDTSDIRANIQTFRKKYKGNYDGFLGKVYNFDWKLNPDLSYDITIQLMTLGDVITSLKTKTPSSFTKGQLRSVQEKLVVERYGFGFNIGEETKKDWTEEAAKLGNDQLPNLGSDKITIDITNIELNFSDLYKRKDGNYLPFWRFVPSVGEVGGANLVDYDIGNETFLLGDKPDKVRGSLKENTYIIPQPALRSVKGKYFIRLGEFLNNFFKSVNNYSNTKDSESPTPELIFEEDVDNTFCNYEMNLIPLDPTVCIFSGMFSTDFLNKLGITEVDQTISTLTRLMSNQGYFSKIFAIKKNDVVVGKLMNLYISTNFIFDKLNSNTDQKGNLSVFRFLQNICDGINTSMAGVTNIEPVIKDDVKVTFVEQNTPKGYPRIPNNVKTKVASVPFELVGYNSESGNSNFVKDFGFVTKITPDLGNIISIGAASTDSDTKTIQALPFNEWNKGLINRYKAKYIPTEEEDLPSPQTPEEAITEAFIKNATIQNPGSDQWHIRWTYNGKTLNWETTQKSDVGGKGWFGTVDNELNQKYLDEFPGFKAEVIAKARLADGVLTVNSLGVNTSEGKNSSDYISYVAQCFGGQRQNYVTKGVIYEIEKVPPFKGKWISQNDDFIALGKSLFKLYLSTQNRLQYELEKVVSNGTGFIPLQLQLTVDGISGVKIYNKLNVDQKFLPSNYPEALNFITMKANQRIEGNVWESEYECFSIPASTAVPSYKLLEVSPSNEITSGDDVLPDNTSEVNVEPKDPRFKKVWRTDGYSTELETTNPYTDTGLMFFEEKTNKTQIVLHHTATKDTSNEMQGILNYWGGKTQDVNGAFIKKPISTHYIIDRQGNYVQVMPDNYWAYNSSPSENTLVQKNQISIELMSDGWLDEKEDAKGKKYYQRGNGKKYKRSEVARPVGLVKNELTPNSWNFQNITYRGKNYFQKYTEAQLIKLEEILYNTAAYNSIKLLPEIQNDSLNFKRRVDEIANFEIGNFYAFRRSYGVRGNIDFGDGDFASRSTGPINVTRGKQAKEWYDALFPKIGQKTIGLNGIGGLYSHNSFNPTKIDVFPQFELLLALVRVGLRRPELNPTTATDYGGALIQSA